MRKFYVVPVLVAALYVTSSAFAAASVKVTNRSKWEIHQFFLAPHASDNWGQDWLGDKVLSNGMVLTLTNVPCDKYDVKVIDEDGDECVIEDAALCDNNSVWDITDKELLSCINDTDSD